tara:strand:- start:7 stop:369 length:363 start_codon:yes stop_codon:yes gene_type:complete
MKDGDIKKLGTFGVDSGQVMIGDPCYLKTYENNDFDYQKKVNKHNLDKSYSYNGACHQTCYNPKKGGEIGGGLAVVSESGVGDGSYDVLAHYRDYGPFGVRIAKLEIVFFDPDEDDEDEI